MKEIKQFATQFRRESDLEKNRKKERGVVNKVKNEYG